MNCKQTVEDHQVHTEHGHFHRRGRFGGSSCSCRCSASRWLNLILADNLFQVFVSWELVGVCSYLLIGFYYERTSAGKRRQQGVHHQPRRRCRVHHRLLIVWTYVGTLNSRKSSRRIRCPDRISRESVALGWQVVGADMVPAVEPASRERQRPEEPRRRLQDQEQGRQGRVRSALPTPPGPPGSHGDTCGANPGCHGRQEGAAARPRG